MAHCPIALLWLTDEYGGDGEREGRHCQALEMGEFYICFSTVCFGFGLFV